MGNEEVERRSVNVHLKNLAVEEKGTWDSVHSRPSEEGRGSSVEDSTECWHVEGNNESEKEGNDSSRALGG